MASNQTKLTEGESTMTSTKYSKRIIPLSTAQAQAYRDMRERQYIAWTTGNRSLAGELGVQMRELRESNPQYKRL
jgi:hypothetical protein